MTDERAALIVANLPDGQFLIRIKFLRNRRWEAGGGELDEDEWFIEDKIDPVRVGRKKGGAVAVVTRGTQPGALTGMDRPYYENAYPVTAVAFGLYPVRAPDLANLAPLRDGVLNCVAQRVVEHFQSALRGQGLTPARRQKIQDWEARVHETGARVGDIADLEKILKRAIVLRDIAGEVIFSSGKYQSSRWKEIDLIAHNGHAWPKDLHFPQAREVHFFDGDVWQAIQAATQGEPLAVWLIGGDGHRLSVDQFALVDGRTYRTRVAHERLKALCRNLGDESLADKAFGENHAASIMAKERNGWKPTPASLLDDVERACVEHGHGGIWNSLDYHTGDVAEIDMRHCYPASFRGQGEARAYFARYGLPMHRMTRVAINGPLPDDIGSGFAEVVEWEFSKTAHPVIHAWYARHIVEKGWLPVPLLAYLVESRILKHHKVREAIIAFEKQTEVWLPEDGRIGRAVIGKFTQGAKAGGRKMTRRLVTDKGELDFLVRDTRQSGTLVGAPEKNPLGWTLSYYDGSQPQYAHLRAYVLAYSHINLLMMIQRFEPAEVVRVATDSLYLRKEALRRLDGVAAYVAPEVCTCALPMCAGCFLKEPILPPVSPGQWRDKGAVLNAPQEHASYYAAPEHLCSCRPGGTAKDLPPSPAPRYDDPLSRHRLSYLNGGGGSGKTTRAIELFRSRDPLVFTPTHRLAKEMRTRGVKAQTYHSFFRYAGVRRARATEEDLLELQSQRPFVGKALRVLDRDEGLIIEKDSNHTPGLDADGEEMDAGVIEFVARGEGEPLRYPGKPHGPQVTDKEWTPERMGQRFVPRVIIWDECATTPRALLETFLDWLDQRGVQVICCGDQGQPPPIAGEMPHDWLRHKADYYEEVAHDHRAKDPALKDLKKRIRLQSDKVQCREMREALPGCLGWDRFVEAWRPGDLILTSRQKVRDRTQQLLFERHKEHFPDAPVPLLYHPKDSRKQNVMVTIPGSDEKEELVLNDVVDVSIEAAEAAISSANSHVVTTDDWRLGYAMTVHSSQGLTIHDPQKVWIIDDFLQWSNLAYLAVSRVEYMHQLERVVCPPEEGSEGRPPQTEQQVRNIIARKIVAYKHQDRDKGLARSNLNVDHILRLKEAQNNRCAACTIELLWAYQPKDTQQFSVDRLDNSRGHTRDNVRLTCLECNRRRGAAALNV